MEYIVDNEELLRKRIFEKDRLAKYVEQEMIKKYGISEAETARFKKSHEYITEFARRFYYIFLRLYLLTYYSNLDRGQRQKQADLIISTRELEKITLMSYLQFEDFEKDKLLHLELEFAQKSRSKDKYREVLYTANAETNGVIFCRVFYFLRQEIPQEAEKNIDCTLASMMGDLCKDMVGDYVFSLSLYAFKNYMEMPSPLDSYPNKMIHLESIRDMSSEIFLTNCMLPVRTQIDLVSLRIVDHMYKTS
ncbi:MAG: hypothetical protein FJZ16_03560 [Candidatus Omnitrophica bacterium]|nr:hypothetical protein [Candidatus Omnitrophota bacterium]